MALYRLHKVEWEKQLRPATEAYKAKTGKGKTNQKRKREDGEGEGEEGEEEADGGERGKKRAHFPGGGRKGISSGLGAIVRKNGVRVDKRSGRALDGGREEAGGGGGSNWWEE